MTEEFRQVAKRASVAYGIAARLVESMADTPAPTKTVTLALLIEAVAEQEGKAPAALYQEIGQYLALWKDGL